MSQEYHQQQQQRELMMMMMMMMMMMTINAQLNIAMMQVDESCKRGCTDDTFV